jgi:hypothetical protein
MARCEDSPAESRAGGNEISYNQNADSEVSRSNTRRLEPDVRVPDEPPFLTATVARALLDLLLTANQGRNHSPGQLEED